MKALLQAGVAGFPASSAELTMFPSGADLPSSTSPMSTLSSPIALTTITFQDTDSQFLSLMPVSCQIRQVASHSKRSSCNTAPVKPLSCKLLVLPLLCKPEPLVVSQCDHPTSPSLPLKLSRLQHGRARQTLDLQTEDLGVSVLTSKSKIITMHTLADTQAVAEIKWEL